MDLVGCKYWGWWEIRWVPVLDNLTWRVSTQQSQSVGVKCGRLGVKCGHCTMVQNNQESRRKYRATHLFARLPVPPTCLLAQSTAQRTGNFVAHFVHIQAV